MGKSIQLLCTILKYQSQRDNWTFIEREVSIVQIASDNPFLIAPLQTPQQQNGYDCGVFTCCSMLTEAFDSEYTFTQPGITGAREHIFIQLLRQAILLPEYNLQYSQP